MPGLSLHLLLPTSVILGLSFPIWSGNTDLTVLEGVGLGTILRAGDTQEGIFCPQAGMQWGPGGLKKEGLEGVTVCRCPRSQ